MTGLCVCSFHFHLWFKKWDLEILPLGRRSCFPACEKIALRVLELYTDFLDRRLIEHLNGNIHFQPFCGILGGSSRPFTNSKIICTICQDIDSLIKMVNEK